jgi:hypothetical protein
MNDPIEISIALSEYDAVEHRGHVTNPVINDRDR